MRAQPRIPPDGKPRSKKLRQPTTLQQERTPPSLKKGASIHTVRTHSNQTHLRPDASAYAHLTTRQYETLSTPMSPPKHGSEQTFTKPRSPLRVRARPRASKPNPHASDLTPDRPRQQLYGAESDSAVRPLAEICEGLSTQISCSLKSLAAPPRESARSPSISLVRRAFNRRSPWSGIKVPDLLGGSA